MDYEVMVQTIESNEENISITGVVNGQQVGAVVPLSKKPRGGKAAVDKFYAEALADAYLARPKTQPSMAAIRVVR